MRIPSILRTRYFWDRRRCHIRFRQPKKIPEMNFALVYTKMNKNSRRICAYPLSWVPGDSGFGTNVIFVFGNLKKPHN